MNGFRTFLAVLLICIVIGIWLSQGPTGCQPPDMGDCIWNMQTNEYDCPEEK